MEVRYPPLKRGISAILARYPMKTRQMGAIPPSAILSRKGLARYGGVSRTGPLIAAKVVSLMEFGTSLRQLIQNTSEEVTKKGDQKIL